MDSEVKLFIERSENELRLAKAIFNLSQNEEEKIKLGTNPNDTFYSATISHAYYAIFYSAKAMLLSRGIKTKAPEIHKKTYEEFKNKLVETGILDTELLIIYSKTLVKADELLSLFEEEKKKRGSFTYKTIAQANIEPAEESIQHAKKFVANITQLIKGARLL